MQVNANHCVVMTNSNFIEIPNSEGHTCEFINSDDIASFHYSPATTREERGLAHGGQVPVESAITIRLKNGKSVVCRGHKAEALREKLTDGS